jgi:hypothetical protein
MSRLLLADAHSQILLGEVRRVFLRREFDAGVVRLTLLYHDHFELVLGLGLRLAQHRIPIS